MVNTMAADDLVTGGARESAAMVLAQFDQSIPFPSLVGLMALWKVRLQGYICGGFWEQKINTFYGVINSTHWNSTQIILPTHSKLYFYFYSEVKIWELSNFNSSSAFLILSLGVRKPTVYNLAS